MDVEAPSHEVWCQVQAAVEQQRSALVAWLRQRGVSFADQCDLLQNVKLRVASWLSRKKRQPMQAPAVVSPNLVWAAMKRLIVDRHRQLQRMPQGSLDGFDGIPWAGDKQSGQSDLAENVARALLAMPEPDASVRQLAYFEGITQAELSQRYGVSPGTISRRISRILEQLRRTSELQGGLHV